MLELLIANLIGLLAMAAPVAIARILAPKGRRFSRRATRRLVRRRNRYGEYFYDQAGRTDQRAA